MFKICNDKTYYVVQTTSEDVVVEIYTKKDGRGSDISLHEMHLDLCRAIRKLQHDGYTIMKVYPAMGDRRESIDVLSMPDDIPGSFFLNYGLGKITPLDVDIIVDRNESFADEN